MSQRGSGNGKNGVPSGARTMSIAFNPKAGPSKPAKKGSIFSNSSSKKAVLDNDDDEEEGALANLATKKPNLLDPPSEPKAASNSIKRPDTLPKKPEVQTPEPPSLLSRISWEDPPITPAPATSRASKAASSRDPASASTSTSEQTQYYKPSRAEAAALARTKEASSASSSTALKDDYAPSRPVQPLAAPKMAISLGKGLAKSAGLPPKPNAFKEAARSSASLSSSSSKHASTSRSGQPSDSLSSSRGSGKGVASNRNVFSDHEREASPPPDRATISSSKGKERAKDLDKPAESEPKQKRKSRWSESEAPLVYGSDPAGDSQSIASTSALPAEPSRIPTPPPAGPEPEVIPETPPKPRKLKNSKWATPEPEVSEPSKPAPAHESKKDRTTEKNMKREPGTPPPPARAVSETDVEPSRQDARKTKSREPGTPPRPSISISLSASTATITKQIFKAESIQPDRARSRTSSRPRMDDEARTPPPRLRRHDEPGTPPRQWIKDEPGTPPRPPRLQEPGTPPRSNLSPEISLSRPAAPLASPRRRAASISKSSPPLPRTQRQATPPPPTPPSTSRPATPPPPPPPAIVVSEKPEEILRPPPISLKKPPTTAKAQSQQPPPSPFLSTDFTAEIERPPSPTLTEKEEEREKSFFVVYNPALEAKPVAQSSEPIIRYEGFNHPRQVEDPRQKNDKADWNALLRTSRSSRPLKVVQHIKDKHYSYDKNSTCPPPPLIPTAILVSGLAYFATAEKLRSHFSAYGIISDIDLKTDPKTAGLLGICWIKYVDQVARKLYGPEGGYTRKATGVQDGNLAAQEAIKRNHDQKVPTLARPIDKISVVMDGEKVLTEQKFSKIISDRRALEDQKYGRKPALAAAAEITKPEPSSSSTPIAGRSTPDDPRRQRTISSASSTIAPKPSSLTPQSSLPGDASLPPKPSTTNDPPKGSKTLSIELNRARPPQIQPPKKHNPFENVPTAPKAFMSPTAPLQNRPNVQRTPTGVNFPPSAGKLPQSAGAPSGQRGPLKLPTNKTPDKSGNQEESSSSSSEGSDDEHEDDDRRKREDEDKIFFPRSARAGQDIVKDTVEALSPMKDPTPGAASASSIQDLTAKVTAYKRLEDSKLPFVKVARSSFPNYSTLQAWMQGSHPLKIFGDSFTFYVTFRNSDAAASAVEVLRNSPFQGKLVKMIAQDALSLEDVQALETQLANMSKAQGNYRANRGTDHYAPRKDRFDKETRGPDHWSPGREDSREKHYGRERRPTEAEVLSNAMQIIGIDLQAAFMEDLRDKVVAGRISAAWEKHSSTHSRQAHGPASPLKAHPPTSLQSSAEHAFSTSLALQAATQDQSSTASLAPGILPSFTRKKVVSITARPMQAEDARHQPEQRDLPSTRGLLDSYRPAPSAPSARERSASTVNDHSASPQRKPHSQLPLSENPQAKRAEPAPIPPSARQEESIKPVKKAEAKPKRAQPKIAFTSSEESEDEFEAAAELVKKREAEKKRQRSQKKAAKRRKSVSKVISSPLSAPEDEEQEEDEDDEPEKLEILPTPLRQKVVVKEITPPAADYASSDLSDLTDLSDLEDDVSIPPPTPLTAQVRPAPEPTSKRALDEVEPEAEQAVRKLSKKPRLASPEPTPLLDDPLIEDVEEQVEFVLPLELRERSRSSDKVATPALDEPEVQEEAPDEEEEEEETAPTKDYRKKGKAGRRRAAPKSKKKKKVTPAAATPAASTRSRTTSRALSATPDIQALGLAEDDEDSYYLRLQMERVRSGKTFFPDEIPEEPEAPEGYQRPPPRHDTGCARAEGYYRVPQAEKLSYLAARNQAQVDTTQGGTSSIAISRLARVNARHLVSGLDKTKKATASDADVLQFNQLRTRKKQLRFARSPIHDWGLYAQEYIPAGEMVIEYVGEQIRQQVADKREKQYERQGIGSSYLFRVDDDVVIDATMKGNLGRLINHCCTPNCNARILSVGSSKKIVIYAKQPIYEGDEITYDYHFPLEDEKIPCLCGMSGCRGFLN